MLDLPQIREVKASLVKMLERGLRGGIPGNNRQTVSRRIEANTRKPRPIKKEEGYQFTSSSAHFYILVNIVNNPALFFLKEFKLNLKMNETPVIMPRKREAS